MKNNEQVQSVIHFYMHAKTSRNKFAFSLSVPKFVFFNELIKAKGICAVVHNKSVVFVIGANLAGFATLFSDTGRMNRHNAIGFSPGLAPLIDLNIQLTWHSSEVN